MRNLLLRHKPLAVTAICLGVAAPVVGCGGGDQQHKVSPQAAPHHALRYSGIWMDFPTKKNPYYGADDMRGRVLVVPQHGKTASLGIQLINGARLTKKDVRVQVLEASPDGKSLIPVTPTKIDGSIGTKGVDKPTIGPDGTIHFGDLPNGWWSDATVEVPRLGDQRSQYRLTGAAQLSVNGQRVAFKSGLAPTNGGYAVVNEIGW
jgi:hypothetical protein